MTLTVCPLSNLKLCVVDDMVGHPIGRMLELGLRATVNSDDPAYFGGYVGDNYRAIAASGVVGRDEIITLARNSFTGELREPGAEAGVDRPAGRRVRGGVAGSEKRLLRPDC